MLVTFVCLWPNSWGNNFKQERFTLTRGFRGDRPSGRGGCVKAKLPTSWQPGSREKEYKKSLGQMEPQMIHPDVSQLAPTSCLSHLLIMLSGDASIRSFTGSEFWLIISEWEKLVHGFSVGRGVGQSVEQGLLSHCHTNHGYIMIAVFPRNEKSASWPGPLTLLCLYKLLKEW